jgi:hypothetical protein
VPVLILFAILAPLQSAAPIPRTPAAAVEDVRLVWKLKEGETLRYRIAQDSHQVTEGMGNFETDANGAQVVRETVKSVGADGTAKLECSWEALRIKMSVPMGGDMEFDSTRTEDASTSGPLKGLGKVVGATFLMELKADGEVASISGVTDAFSKAFPDSDAGSKMAKSLVGRMFNDEGMRRTMQSAFLPEKAVAQGATWKHDASYVLPSLGELKVHFDYSFAGTEDAGGGSCAKLAVKTGISFGNVKPDFSGSPMMERFDVDLKLEDGKGEGTVLFSPALGRLIQSSSVADLDFDMSMKPKGAGEEHGGDPMKMTVSTSTKQTIALLAAGDPPFAPDTKPAAKDAKSPKDEKKK